MNFSFSIESMIVGFLLATIPFTVYFLMQRRVSDSSSNILNDQLSKMEKQLAAMAVTHAAELEKARHELSIVTYPYENLDGDDGWFVDDRVAEIGYQFQLFIKGIPCFDPHTVITSRIRKKEVNQEKLAKLRNDVESLLSMVASRHPAFEFSKVLRKVA